MQVFVTREWSAKFQNLIVVCGPRGRFHQGRFWFPIELLTFVYIIRWWIGDIYLSAQPLDKHLYNLIFISRFWGKSYLRSSGRAQLFSSEQRRYCFLLSETPATFGHRVGRQILAYIGQKKKKRKPRAYIGLCYWCLVYPLALYGLWHVCRLDVIVGCAPS
jgi:hypothetical protein